MRASRARHPSWRHRRKGSAEMDTESWWSANPLPLGTAHGSGSARLEHEQAGLWRGRSSLVCEVRADAGTELLVDPRLPSGAPGPVVTCAAASECLDGPLAGLPRTRHWARAFPFGQGRDGVSTSRHRWVGLLPIATRGGLASACRAPRGLPRRPASDASERPVSSRQVTRRAQQ